MSRDTTRNTFDAIVTFIDNCKCSKCLPSTLTKRLSLSGTLQLLSHKDEELIVAKRSVSTDYCDRQSLCTI